MTASLKFVTTAAGMVLSGALFAPWTALGTQQCNTECQERFTDCMDRCDGVATCQKECNRVVDACVKACTLPPAPSGSASSAPSSGSR